MADNWGYAVVQTDRAGMWTTDGYVGITDASGTPDFTQVPSGIIQSVVRNSTGNYSIILRQAWYALPEVHVQTVVPSGNSPGQLSAQIQSFTVGNSAVLPISAGGVGQKVTFQVYNPATGSAAELPKGAGFFFKLSLKQSSA